jgi:hypothetical protein
MLHEKFPPQPWPSRPLPQRQILDLLLMSSSGGILLMFIISFTNSLEKHWLSPNYEPGTKDSEEDKEISSK